MPDRPTNRPPRPTTKRFESSGADSRHVYRAQESILGAVRMGATALLDRFLDEYRRLLREELLTLCLQIYEEGKAKGRASRDALWRAYLAVVERKRDEAAARLDPRRERERPRVTAREVHQQLSVHGVDAIPAEVVEQCKDAGIELDEPEE